ncbi:HAD family phosphatase [uncultured Faecalibaculum sp.]|uniref:HAD family hydrolase n=1 Tax=uncultured Faecalibaculum sp. TaxID=1729681 RepID=UPI0025CED95D|nr:HAD family phosphatase [uncultured Faecalibaculum sp.]
MEEKKPVAAPFDGAQIRGVIFDMDGLMFDTETMFLKVLPEIGMANGYDIPPAAARAMMGCDSRKAVELEDQYPGLNHCLNEEYTPNRLKYFYEMFPAPGSADEPGLCELTEYLEEQNIPYAVASSSTRSDIMAFLAHAGRQLHPACILSGKEGFRSKPNPDIFLAAAMELGIDPAQALVLEDSAHGVKAARDGGFPCIWIPDVVEPDEEMRRNIQMELPTLADVKEWLEQARGRKQEKEGK